MNHAEIRAARKSGDSTWEILAALVAKGMEFPDASARVKAALGLDMEETEQMERDYDACC